jgi:uncharacterized protein (TIGR02266 family)
VIKYRNGRIPVEINCWLEGAEGMSCVTTYDLSDSGVSLLTPDPLPEERVVTLKFFTPFSAEPLTVKGEVVWSRMEPDGGMGVRFLDMDEEMRSILRRTANLLRRRNK